MVPIYINILYQLSASKSVETSEECDVSWVEYLQVWASTSELLQHPKSKTNGGKLNAHGRVNNKQKESI